MFVVSPFFFGGSRQIRIASADRDIRTLLSSKRMGLPATQLDLLDVKRASSYTISTKIDRPDLYVFMDRSVPLEPFCEIDARPNFAGYNVHIVPMPPQGDEVLPRERAVALGLLNKPGYNRLNDLDLVFTRSSQGHEIATRNIDRAWEALSTDEMKTIQSVWAKNEKIFANNPDYAIFAVVGDRAYKLRHSAVPAEILKNLKEMVR